MRTATIYPLSRLVGGIDGPARAGAKINGKWVPARPLGFIGLCIGYRLKCAWLAFTGKCDLVKWPEGQ